MLALPRRARRQGELMNARLLALLLFSFSTISMSKTSLIYIATQNPEKAGLTVAEFDDATGALSEPRLVIETRDPAHFELNARGTHLYMCNTGTPGGISAFAVENKKTGALKFLNYVESKGRGPSYVSVDGSGKYVLDANYGGGYVEVLALNGDGSLKERTAFVQHIGSSVHPRQSKPYAHWLRTDPSNKFALAMDLGMDQVVVYRFDASTGKLTPNDPAFATVTPGSGPRHLAYHPNGKWMYGVQELSNEVVAFQWDAGKGTLTQFQAVKTLSESFKDASTAAEIAVRADGKFLYASNRGEDSIVVYAIDARTGELTLKQRVSSGGKVPRYFAFDPSNKWLLVSNQDGGNVTVFSVDNQSGELAQKGAAALSRPMALAFLPR
jgi:6-phosphogluconolactonase